MRWRRRWRRRLRRHHRRRRWEWRTDAKVLLGKVGARGDQILRLEVDDLPAWSILRPRRVDRELVAALLGAEVGGSRVLAWRDRFERADVVTNSDSQRGPIAWESVSRWQEECNRQRLARRSGRGSRRRGRLRRRRHVAVQHHLGVRPRSLLAKDAILAFPRGLREPGNAMIDVADARAHSLEFAPIVELPRHAKIAVLGERVLTAATFMPAMLRAAGNACSRPGGLRRRRRRRFGRRRRRRLWQPSENVMLTTELEVAAPRHEVVWRRSQLVCVGRGCAIVV